MSVVVFAYHDVGCAGIRTLARLGVDIALAHVPADDPNENRWYASVADVCREMGTATRIGANPNLPEEVAHIRSLRPDALFSFYYRDLLTDAVLDTAAHGGVNVHGSLLPRYRGRAPVNWQILNGETQGGVTLHYMVRRADAGDIVDQEAVPIGPDDTPVDVYRRMVPATERVLERSALAVIEGRAPRAKQLESAASKFPRRRPADGCIDWFVRAEDVRNLVRAVTAPYPGAFALAGTRPLTIWWTRHVEERAAVAAPPGALRCDAAGRILVTCGDARELHIVRASLDGAELEGTALAAALAGLDRLLPLTPGDL